jgi:hypothetical protein
MVEGEESCNPLIGEQNFIFNILYDDVCMEKGRLRGYAW